MFQEKIQYNGWSDCVRLFNKEIEIIVTTSVGPRIIHFGFIGGPNLFYVSPEEGGMTGGDKWRLYGGHRLWIAPEAIPLSYHPDNSAVECVFSNGILNLVAARESTSGVKKEMRIILSQESNDVTVSHQLTNENVSDLRVSVWAISALAPGGFAVVPQEPYGEGNDFLLPARPIALWHYTKMNDPRWIWGEKYILAQHDAKLSGEQKIAVLNKQGWAGYCLGQTLLLKRFSFNADATYPDYGCNNEIYINGDFLEVETLGPLLTLAPKEIAVHTEEWSLKKIKTAGQASEAFVDKVLLPKIR